MVLPSCDNQESCGSPWEEARMGHRPQPLTPLLSPPLEPGHIHAPIVKNISNNKGWGNQVKRWWFFPPVVTCGNQKQHGSLWEETSMGHRPPPLTCPPSSTPSRTRAQTHMYPYCEEHFKWQGMRKPSGNVMVLPSCGTQKPCESPWE